MFKRMKLQKQEQQGQGIVEFAIVLPVVLLLIFGVIEFGFLIFSYSSVNTASREAARYGIAIGNVTGGQRYYDCDGIVNAGMSIGKFAGMDTSDFTIVYDSGPGSAVEYPSCEDLADENGNDTISFGDRIVVTVNHDYKPIVSYMGLYIAPFTMTSTSSRTIVKNVSIIPGGGSSGPTGGGGGGGGGPSCYALTRSKTETGGSRGATPIASPTKSDECTTVGYFIENETITLNAYPDTGSIVTGWNGTDDDTSTADTNTLTMPASDWNVTVIYGLAP